jgi:hypothetical protein
MFSSRAVRPLLQRPTSIGRADLVPIPGQGPEFLETPGLGLEFLESL